jgi:hypothetical protein
MTIQIKVDPEIERQLRVGAHARGIPVEQYAEALLRDAAMIHSEPTGRLSIEQLHAMLGAIAKGSSKLPNLPTSAFTRESFYDDRP